ncbi:hypothetical protein OPT61_g4608 [Boeremia exigua]|uniref:Uncharacterized protein n=1 Tax=Boeremia exigua TaxID=749465 RepID=A0ACC2IDG9_9PLEO|nr:hypothetical protein OPT61_g4608 [Boeremia exigua]
MATSDFSAPYQHTAMSTGQGAQAADIPGPWPPVASPIHQRQRWDHELDQTFGYHSNGPFLPPPPLQYRNSPYPPSNYPQSPYTPYAVHGGSHLQLYPPPTFSFPSHQPRPPPAIRNGHVDAFMNSPRSDRDMYREASANYGSYYTDSHGHIPHSMPPQPAAPADSPSSGPFDGNLFVHARGSGGIEHHSIQTLPLHPRYSGTNHFQRPEQNQRRHADRHAATRHVEHAEPRTPRNLNAQTRRPDRSSSPRTSTRRSFNRYSADLSLSSTSSDVEEAAARSPPSDRIRHQPRESRLRFFRQVYDPNVTTDSQLQALKASLPKLLPGDLNEETSPACDICAKDYSATHVQPSEEEEVALKLPCGHTFGEFCISQWFDTCKTHKNKVTCPMCRKQLIEPERLPCATDRFDATMFNPTMYMHAARGSQSFRELLANELQAQLKLYAQSGVVLCEGVRPNVAVRSRTPVFGTGARSATGLGYDIIVVHPGIYQSLSAVSLGVYGG